eukprot:GHVT01017146.1.p2 GENE.GHVT01017146.1~~GHVT01017146.1.p2  ORF type:complete len:118 (+),score=12.90 GHVT01017146.1:1296-1649(+)
MGCKTAILECVSLVTQIIDYLERLVSCENSGFLPASERGVLYTRLLTAPLNFGRSFGLYLETTTVKGARSSRLPPASPLAATHRTHRANLLPALVEIRTTNQPAEPSPRRLVVPADK